VEQLPPPVVKTFSPKSLIYHDRVPRKSANPRRRVNPRLASTLSPAVRLVESDVAALSARTKPGT
jgi:hypothetical protein